MLNLALKLIGVWCSVHSSFSVDLIRNILSNQGRIFPGMTFDGLESFKINPGRILQTVEKLE